MNTINSVVLLKEAIVELEIRKNEQGQHYKRKILYNKGKFKTCQYHQEYL